MSALWTSDEVARAMVPSTISAPFEASGVTFDSRAVGKGDLFFALSGETTDGHGFVERNRVGLAAGGDVTHGRNQMSEISCSL